MLGLQVAGANGWFQGEVQEPLQPVPSPVPEESKHSWLYSMMRKHSHRTRAKVFTGVITFLIMANVVIFVVSTKRDMDEDKSGFYYFFESTSSVS